jgi:hypothetical protein
MKLLTALPHYRHIAYIVKSDIVYIVKSSFRGVLVPTVYTMWLELCTRHAFGPRLAH